MHGVAVFLPKKLLKVLHASHPGATAPWSPETHSEMPSHVLSRMPKRVGAFGFRQGGLRVMMPFWSRQSAYTILHPTAAQEHQVAEPVPGSHWNKKGQVAGASADSWSVLRVTRSAAVSLEFARALIPALQCNWLPIWTWTFVACHASGTRHPCILPPLHCLSRWGANVVGEQGALASLFFYTNTTIHFSTHVP